MTNALPEGAYDYVSDKDGFVVTSSSSQVLNTIATMKQQN
jgi:hypothetical protein